MGRASRLGKLVGRGGVTRLTFRALAVLLTVAAVATVSSAQAPLAPLQAFLLMTGDLRDDASRDFASRYVAREAGDAFFRLWSIELNNGLLERSLAQVNKTARTRAFLDSSVRSPDSDRSYVRTVEAIKRVVGDWESRGRRGDADGHQDLVVHVVAYDWARLLGAPNEMPTPECVGRPDFPKPPPHGLSTVEVRVVQLAGAVAGETTFRPMPSAARAFLRRAFGGDGYRFGGVVYLNDPDLVLRDRAEAEAASTGPLGPDCRMTQAKPAEPLRFGSERPRLKRDMTFDVRAGKATRLDLFAGRSPSVAVEPGSLRHSHSRGRISEVADDGMLYTAPKDAASETDAFSVSVELAGLGRTEPAPVTVRVTANRPPVATSQLGRARLFGSRGHSIRLQDIFSDPDGDAIKWDSIEVKPKWLQYTVEGSQLKLSYSAEPRPRDLTLALSVADELGARSEVVTIAATIEEAKRLPTVRAKRQLQFRLDVGEALSLALGNVFEDPSGGDAVNGLRFADPQPSNDGLTVRLADPRSVEMRAKPRSPQAPYVAKLRAILPDGSPIEADVTVTLVAPPPPPPRLALEYKVRANPGRKINPYPFEAIFGREISDAYQVTSAVGDADVEAWVESGNLLIKRSLGVSEERSVTVQMRPKAGGAVVDTRVVESWPETPPIHTPVSPPPPPPAVLPPPRVPPPPAPASQKPAATAPLGPMIAPAPDEKPPGLRLRASWRAAFEVRLEAFGPARSFKSMLGAVDGAKTATILIPPEQVHGRFTVKATATWTDGSCAPRTSFSFTIDTRDVNIRPVKWRNPPDRQREDGSLGANVFVDCSKIDSKGSSISELVEFER